MRNASSNPNDREARLEQAIADYLRAIEAGQPVDRTAILAAHPDLADDLRSFFQNRAAMERLAEPLRAADTPTMTVAGERPATAHQMPTVRYFGDYELLDELGRGGMGVVFRARQTTLNRLVALKMIIAGQLATPEDVQRFKHEAEAAANLDHPNIAPIYETGEHNGQQYFSMKLIEGRSLRDAWDGSQSRETAAVAGVRLLAAVARAVHHAHQRGVLHRDLKPGNILLDQDDTPYVTDFGLAKRVEGGSDVTRTGAILGTPSYMAPEQAHGEKVLTTAVDVYSLGAMLYELLAGRPPFREASPIETLLKSLSSEPVRPSALVPPTDRDLETIALKCLDKDATKRYDSAAALADDLDRWLRGEPINARPVSTWERARKWARRNSLVATLAAGLLLVLMGGVAGIIWQWRQAVEQRALAVSRAEENQQRVVHQYVANGVGALDRERSLEAMVWFAEALKLDRPDAASQEPHRRRWGALGRQIPQLVQVFAHDQHAGATFSPDGQRIATWSGNQVWLWDAGSGQPIGRPLEQAERVWNVVFRADSKQIVVASNPANLPDPQNYMGHIAVFETEHGRAVGPSRQAPQLNAWHVRFTPDGTRVLLSAGKRIELHDVETWRDAWPAIEHRLRVYRLAISPDGKRLLANFGDYEAENVIQLYDLATGQPAPAGAATWQEFGEDSPFSPDGRFFATFTSDPTGGRGDGPTTIQLWDADTGEPRTKFEVPRAVRRLLLVGREPTVIAHLNDERLYFCSPLADEPEVTHWLQPIWSFAVSPEGQRIAAQRRDDRGISLFNREMLGGMQAEIPVSTPADQLAFSPDGQRLAVSARGPEARQGTVHLIDLNSNERVSLAVGHLYGQMTTTFSSGSRRLLTSDEDGVVRVWDVTTLGSVLRPCAELNDQGVSLLELSPSEKWLAIGQGHHDMAVDRGGAEPFGLLRVWNLADGSPVGPEMKFTARVEAVQFSVDDRRAAVTLSDGSAALVDVVSGERVEEFATEKDKIAWALIGADGELVLQRTPRRIGYGNEPLPPGRIERRRPGAASPLSSIVIDEHQLARLSPRGDRVLLVRPTREAVLLDTSTGQEQTSFGRLHGEIRRAEFSRDGRRLALIFDDEIAEIWDVETARIAARLIRQVEVARFSQRGTELLTGKDGVYRVWDATTGEPLTGSYPIGAAVNPPRMSAVPVLGPDANSLLSTAGDRLREWRLAPDERPVERLVELAQVMSGHEIDEVGGYATRPVSALVAEWRGSETLAPTADEIAAWHEREAWQCETRLPSEPFRGSEQIPALGVREHISGLLAERADGRLYSRRGTAHLHLGDGAAAVADFTSAMKLGLDSDPLTHLRRGRAHDMVGNREAAADDVAHAFELGQRELLQPEAKWERVAAIRGLTRRLEKKDDDWPSVELRADLEWQVLDFAACLRDLDQLLAAGRKTYYLPYRRAWCLSEVGRGEEAIAAFTQQLGEKEDDPEDVEGRAYVRAKLGQFAAAADDMRKANRLYASRFKTWRQEAVFRLLAGDQAGYQRCCDESRKALRANYGELLQRIDGLSATEVACTCILSASGTNDLATIVALARQGVRDNFLAPSDKTLPIHTLAWALCRQKEPTEALTLLSRLEHRQQATALTFAIKALAYRLQDNNDEFQKSIAAADRELADHQVSTPTRFMAELLLRELRAK